MNALSANRLEILQDFLQITPQGLYCTYGEFYIDPQQPVRQAVVSHAHGDHAVPGNGMAWCTPATAAFMSCRHAKHSPTVYSVREFGQPFRIGNVELCFYPAGHILGSAQILLRYAGVSYLYTGDYKLQRDDTCEPLVAIQADVLITESTFADPATRHPDPVAEIRKLKEKPQNILLGTYALGKAQRLTSLINTCCPERTVLVHHSILPLHRLYDQLGPKTLHYQPYDRKLMKKQPEGFVYLVPPITFNSYFRATAVLRVFASGWHHLHQRNDLALVISDHADWTDILAYIEQVDPREIWTVHGRGASLQAHFSGKIPVRLLDSC